jgi:sec-independent protein translocase protein TatC
MKVIPRRKRSTEERTSTMTVVEHLQELRHRLIICLYALAAGSVVGWFLYPHFMNLITAPYCDYLAAHPEQALATKVPTSADCTLFITGPIDATLVKIKVVVFLGLVVALPVVLYQLWAFVAPGLTAKEKKYSIPFVVSAFVLFLLGVIIAYVMLPKGFNFLLGFAGEGVVPLLTADRYVGFVVLVALAFGVSFLFPIFLVFLELAGILSPQTLSKYRRYSILGIAIFAAVITPSSDPYTMLAMMIPMYLFYEASIIIGRFLQRSRVT